MRWVAGLLVVLLVVLAPGPPGSASPDDLETSVRPVLEADEIAVPDRSRSYTHLETVVGCGDDPAGRFTVDGDPSDWRGEPTGIAGTGRHSAGEYVWTDYPYDDGGTGNLRYPGDGEQLITEKGAVELVLEREGRVGRVTERLDRYGGSAADVTEVRVAADADHLYLLVRTNFLNAVDSTAVGLGVHLDDDPSTGFDEWPLGARLRTPGLDLFLTLHGTCGVVTTSEGNAPLDAAGGALRSDTHVNAFEVVLPRTLIGAAETIRLVGGAGVWDPAVGTWMAPETLGGNRNSTDRVTGAQTDDDPAVFNLLFRGDEPMVDLNDALDSGSSNSSKRVHQTQRQQEVLAGGTSGPYEVSLDLDRLTDGAPDDPMPLRRSDDVAFTRVHRSRVDLEGIVWDGNQPVYLGRWQPYAVWLPSCYSDGCPQWAELDGRPPLAMSFHGGDGSHVNEMSEEAGIRQAERFVSEVGGLWVAPLGRGRRNPWWRGLGEVDALEVLQDVRTRYGTDRDRQVITGASLGGYATLRLGSVYADLWAGAAAHCPAEYENSTSDREVGNEAPSTQPFVVDPLLRNLTTVPLVQVSGTGDPLVRITSGHRIRDRALGEGLDLRYTEYPNSSHCFLVPGVAGGWMDNHMQELIDMVRRGRTNDPARVRYAVDPRHYPEATEVIGSYDIRDVGVRFDGAWWVSGLVVRPSVTEAAQEMGVFVGGNAPTSPGEEVVGWIDATSHARGGWDRSTSSCGDGIGLAGLYGGNPKAEPDTSGNTGLPYHNPHFYRCQAASWDGDPEPVLDLVVTNLAAATVDAQGAGLFGPFELRATGDGPFTLRLEGTPTPVSGDCVVSSARDGEALVVELDLDGSVCAVSVG